MSETTDITIWIVQREHTAEYVAAFLSEREARAFVDVDRAGGRMFVAKDRLRVDHETGDAHRASAVIAALGAAVAARQDATAPRPAVDQVALRQEVIVAIAGLAMGETPVQAEDVSAALEDQAPSGEVIRALEDLRWARTPYIETEPLAGSKWRRSIRLTDLGRQHFTSGAPDRDIDVTREEPEASEQQED